ncbi:MAG TPA: hypothetical protein VHA10_20745 [Hypericibacter adhaerens]|jgi:hypothetical protein|uniref:Uncharacterized protein n=1 Tax=Hypericibacter adhaerens TaxID=2602016 RepID=A0A5J6MV04_9PROT|nr:hypothetical protein [Hypericibacter adhaerens]QEX21498.1 hypothetical protein FRZ61_14270 [Hypericibacter adhaerens]HWA45659.1 hypothetical protein [Hypericibacter adhaerens]
MNQPVKRGDRNPSFPVWRQPDGKVLSCTEKIKVLNENLSEIRQLAQDALEDAILMGCDEAQIRKVLEDLVLSLDNPYRKNK